MKKVKVIVYNRTTEYSDYCFGVINLKTGKPIEIIDLACSGSSFTTSEFVEELKRKNVYSNFIESLYDVFKGKHVIDIEDWEWDGRVVAKVVIEGIRANRDYDVIYTYGMEYADGWYDIINKVYDTERV